MIKDRQRYAEESEREWKQFLRRLTYAESIRMTEELLSCGLLEQVRLREDDAPISLSRLLHGRAAS
ncbi:MAG TPA: hypothetical protein VJB16_05230 [archaeon]|nr:hypothetical protein [archaeon]